jgi:FkbM family methyltransferase
MEKQLEEGPVRWVLGGVEFDLDVSELEPKAQHHYRAVADKVGIYEPVMTRCLTRIVKQLEAPRFMDIGGFAGYYTCYIAKLLGPDAQPVVTIESNPAYVRGMRRSCELNGLRNVRIYEGILSNVPEPVTVGADGFSVVFGQEEAEAAATATTLDDLCERHSIPAPTVVKMDIHGSEGKALFGMTTLLESVDFLLLELHNQERLEEFSPGISRSDIINLLWERGLSVYFIAGHRAQGPQKFHPAITSGRFAYRKVTPQNADCLFFDRLWDSFLLVTPREDIVPVLGESLDDPFLVY